MGDTNIEVLRIHGKGGVVENTIPAQSDIQLQDDGTVLISGGPIQLRTLASGIGDIDLVATLKDLQKRVAALEAKTH